VLVGSAAVEGAGVRTIEVARRWRATWPGRPESTRGGWPRTRTEPTAASSWSRGRAGFFGSSFVDRQRTALEGLTIEQSNGFLRLSVIAEFDECEASFSSSFAVERDKHVQHVARSREVRANIFFRSVVRKVSNKETDGHVTS
jgi:hypothetical protein